MTTSSGSSRPSSRTSGAEARDRGVLSIVATPIGNLEDITVRALKVLRGADVVACEDTRRTRILLQRYKIRKPLISYFGAAEKGKARGLMERLRAGQAVALVSDAGVPGISDPGWLVVRQAVLEGISVVPVPGPSAALAALAACGIGAGRFVFEGFLPRKGIERSRRLLAIASETRAIVIYESAARIERTLRDLRDAAGEREAVIARELTKLHEEFIRGTPTELLERLRERPPRGEIVLVVAGAEAAVDWAAVDIPSYVAEVGRRMGIDRKSALRLVAELSGIPRSALYRATLRAREEDQRSPQSRV
ncbi:MAG: 16S rRNA (cytidine(1402)-2'-O)-methyltransferase [bacterium]|nr:16S rRNA (cytidine(1402)-2'-O)-methyltransferase [bacterium]